MSELTTPIKIDIPGIGSIESADLYLKSEVDKVIKKKDAKILALDAEVFKQKHHAKLFFDERNYAETQLRHHKYKRCLAMARWCSVKTCYYIERLDKCSSCTRSSYYKTFYERWHKRWLELAEKFKESGK